MEITISITVSQLCLRNTDLVYQYEAQIMREGGIENIRILHLNKDIINRTSMGALKYKYPIEALKNFLDVGN